FNAFRGASSRILVRVTIDDINDNSPVFKEPHKILSIEEGDRNFRHPLDLATDADIGDNGMAVRGKYFLQEDAGGIFALAQTDPGFLSLTLNGQPNIDYEAERQYNLTLTACDGGMEQRCSSQLLIVQVKDRNDNSPNVTRISVREVSENLAIGGLVATIEAHDRDSGRNAELDFSITDPELARVFDIDRAGRVTLKKPLNAKKQAVYEVQLMVSDNGSPRRQTPAKFTVQVSDINDHAPSIE
uniref:PCD17 n=1 Tax=Macrostomum lignano TaxID=282301 RepID=A0A1I8I7H3_9PLAT